MDTYQDWLTARENARAAIEDFRQAASNSAAAEAYYYKAKAIESAKMKANGDPATFISTAIKGNDVVNDALYAYRLAEAETTAAKLASQLFINEESHTFHVYKQIMAGDSDRY